jgi:hypothetical protein
MKIHIFTVTEESYRLGDLNDSHKKLFKTEELRNEYHDHLIKYYKDILKLINYGEADFCDAIDKWAYHIGKGEEDLEIIEEKNW